MSEQEIPHSIEKCRAILLRYHQHREQSYKLQNHRAQLDDKIEELSRQIDADRKLFLEERANELGKLLSAKQTLMRKLKQTRLEVDHWLDAVEEMEERSTLITKRLLHLLFQENPAAEAEWNSLQKAQSAADKAVGELSLIARTLAKIVDNLRYAEEIASTAMGGGILSFLYFWRTPTRMVSAHLEQAHAGALDLTLQKPQEPWLSAMDFNDLQTMAQTLMKYYDFQWGFKTIQKVYSPLRIDLESLQKRVAEALTKAEQSASSTHEKIQTWLLN